MANVKEMDRPTEMQERMKIMRELGTPGAAHKMLAKMAGSWKSKIKSWPDPNKPAVESTGTNEQKMIFDGRYLQQMETGQMGGAPFSGMGIAGFDNRTKKFFMTWIDSMSTSVMLFEGTGAADGKTVNLENSFEDPITGHVTVNAVMHMIDDNNYTFSMSRTAKGGKQEKMMEIAYTRVK